VLCGEAATKAVTGYPGKAALAAAIVPSLITTASWRLPYHAFGIATMIVAVACFFLLRNGTGTTAESRALPGLRPLLHNRDLSLLGLAGFGALWASTVSSPMR
jgi:ACS family glucarate transporter-like MFS transporter